VLRRDHPLALAPGLCDVTKKNQKWLEGRQEGQEERSLTPSVDCSKAADEKAE
jgi:hypothetical protein